MNRTDEQIDAIVLARDILLDRCRRHRNANLNGQVRVMVSGMAAAYESAADILTAALNEDWELLRNYEGA